MQNFTRIIIAASVVLMMAFTAYPQDVYKKANVGVGSFNPLSKLEVNGSFGEATTTINNTTTLDDTYATVLAMPTVPYTITLPLASSAKLRVYTIVYNGMAEGNTITIQASGSDNILADANSSATYSLNGGAVTIQSDGTNWHVTIASPPVDGTAGGIFYGTGPGLAFSAAGSSGQVLQSNGAGVPTWVTPTSGTVTSVSATTPLSITNPSTIPAILLSGATGGVFYGTGVGTGSSYTGAGTTGQIFTNTAGTPNWTTATYPTTTTINQILYSSSANTVTGLATGATGKALLSLGGVPTWAFIPLTASVSGILPIANGGTGASTLTLDGVVYGNGTSAVNITAAPTVGQILIGNASGVPVFVTPNGDINVLTGAGGVTVTGLQGKAISATAPTNDQILVWNGTSWTPTTATAASVNAWGLTGNSGVTYASNFIGTASGTDQGLKLEVNGTTSGRIEDIKTANSAYGNTSLGYLALNAATTAYSNVAIGKEALENNTANKLVAIGDSALASNTSGTNNVAVGYQSLYKNATGINNTAIGSSTLTSNTGSNNTATGNLALKVNTSGNSNAAFGANALSANTTGSYNLALGDSALINNTSGKGNTAVGYGTLSTNTTGSGNTAMGLESMITNLSGINNTSIGFAAMQTNSLGNRNTAVGDSALNSSSTGSNNTAIGYNALNSNTSAGDNTAIGSNALNASITGTGNTATGYNALAKSATSSNNTAIGSAAMSNAATGNDNVAIGPAALQINNAGKDNVVIGYQAMSNNSGGGDNNTAIGSGSLFSNSGTANAAIGDHAQYLNITGNRNISFGDSSLYSNLTSSNNTGIGYHTLYNTTSANNTALGYGAAYSNTSGTSQTATGYGALFNTTTGSRNTAFGDSALVTNTTGTYNTAIGYDADVVSNNLTNATAVGANAVVSASNLVVLGNNASVQFSKALMPNGLAGSSAQMLQSNGVSAAPTWSTATYPSTTTAYQLLYSSATNTVTGLGTGISGQILQTNGSGSAPSWVSPTTVSGTWTLLGNSGIVNPAAPATYGATNFGSSENWIGTTDGKDLAFGTNSIERMRIGGGNVATAGYIGIGTAIPAQLLHVNGTAQLGTTASVNGVLNFASGNASSTGIIAIQAPPTASTAGYILTLPTTAAATNGQVLSSTTGGVLSWLALGGVASLTSTTTAISTPETSIINYAIPANALNAGTTFRLRASGTCTSTAANTSGIRVRIGTTGTNADVAAVALAANSSGTGTAIPFNIDALVTIRTVGSGGTVLGSEVLNVDAATGIGSKTVSVAQTTTAVAVNTTVSNIIQLTYVSAASTTTCTFYNATIEVVKP